MNMLYDNKLNKLFPSGYTGYSWEIYFCLEVYKVRLMNDGKELKMYNSLGDDIRLEGKGNSIEEAITDLISQKENSMNEFSIKIEDEFYTIRELEAQLEIGDRNFTEDINILEALVVTAKKLEDLMKHKEEFIKEENKTLFTENENLKKENRFLRVEKKVFKEKSARLEYISSKETALINKLNSENKELKAKEQ